jgi:hypothetical protein
MSNFPRIIPHRVGRFLPPILIAVALGAGLAAVPAAAFAQSDRPPACEHHRDAAACGQVGLGWG